MNLELLKITKTFYESQSRLSQHHRNPGCEISLGTVNKAGQHESHSKLSCFKDSLVGLGFVKDF